MCVCVCVCVGGGVGREEGKTHRSRHSFTEIICRKGAAKMRCICACMCLRVHTFVFLWVCAASYLFSTGSCLLCTLLCSSDKTLFHSPSTMTYQSPNHNPDCNSLLNLNAQRICDRTVFQSFKSSRPPKLTRFKIYALL